MSRPRSRSAGASRGGGGGAAAARGGTGASLNGSTALALTLERLATLQDHCKRDPSAYREEFTLQLKHYRAELDLLKLNPGGSAEAFVALLGFLAHVSGVYKSALAGFGAELMSLLASAADVLAPDVRQSIAQAIILMRNKRLLEPVPVAKLFFQLFAVPDRTLRDLMLTHIVHDVRAINKIHRDEASNRAIQAFLYLQMESESSVVARKSMEVLVELYRRRVWTDARTVNVMARSLISANLKLHVLGLKFFLGLGSGEGVAVSSGGDDEDGSSSDDEDEDAANAALNLGRKEVRDAMNKHAHSRHTMKRQRKTARMLAGLKKQAKKAAARAGPSFPAIQLLHDAQGIAEKLFSSLRRSKERFEIRLMQMNLTSRLIGQHKLMLLPFYSFLQKYLAAHQASVTQVLAYLVQSCHDLVPPDEVVPIIRTLCNNFIADRCPPEVIQVGLNAVREVVSRCPIVLEEGGMRDLMQELVQYQKYHNRAVVASARALINLIREIYPAVLRKRDWGKDVAVSGAAAAVRPTAYGHVDMATGVEGADLLAIALARKAQRKATDAAAEAQFAAVLAAHGGDDDADGDVAMGGGAMDDDEDGTDAGAHHSAHDSGSHSRAAMSVAPEDIAAVADDDEWAAVHIAKAREAVKASKPGARGRQADSAAAQQMRAAKELAKRMRAARTAVAGGDEARGTKTGDDADDIVAELAPADEDEGHGHGHGHKHGPGCDHDHEEEEDGSDSEEEEDEDVDVSDDDDSDGDVGSEDDDDDSLSGSDADEDEDDEEEDEEEEELAPVAGMKRGRGAMSSSIRRRGQGADDEEGIGSSGRRAARPPQRKRARRDDDEEEDDDEDESEDEDEDMHDTASHPSHSRASTSASAAAAALATSVAPFLRPVAHGGVQLEAMRLLTPKDFERIRKIKAALAERGLSTTSAKELLAPVLDEVLEEEDGEEGGGVIASGAGLAASGGANAALLRKRGKRGGRGLGYEDGTAYSDDEEQEEANQLAVPGATFAPPVTKVDASELEADGTRKKRQAAERLLTALAEKDQKFEGRKAGGGLTNREKERFKNYLMLRKSGTVQDKMRRSLSARHRAIKDQLHGRATQNKRKKQRRRRA